MPGDRQAAAHATPDGDQSRANSVQQALEQFIELHAAGKAPDAASYCERYPVEMRPQILAQCREFLAFDGLLGHQPWEPTPTAEVDGRIFGDFVIQEELGRGGMGIVYLAKQRSLNRRIALKVMSSGLTLSKRHVERFRREAAATAQLRHPAIVSVHSLTEVDGTFALAMDYVAGRNLADVLDDLRLANTELPGAIEGTLGINTDIGYVAECATFCAQLASALAAAHQAGVVHRDLKPRNLMIDDRHQVRLLDFGLAKSLGEGSLSMSGEITGTAHYMSPEQTLAKRVEVDHRADIWALGVILYELLTLQRPFDGKNLQQIVYEICFKEPAPLQRQNPKVPRDLVTICQKALEKDPGNRYQSAAGFEADLLRFLRWEPIHARPASALNRAGKFLRRHRTESVIAAAVVTLTIVVLAVVGYRDHVDGTRHDELLELAQQHATQRDFKAAIAAVQKALELRNDERTISRLAEYQKEDKFIDQQVAWTVTESKQLMEYDREGAILLALEAEAQQSSSKTRSAVLDALGSGCTAITLRDPEAERAIPTTGAAWSADSRHVVTVGYDGMVRCWDPATGRPAAAIRGHATTAPVIGISFTTVDHFVTVSADRTLRGWNLDGEALFRADLPGQASAMRRNADGSRVLVVTYDYDKKQFLAQVWDTARGAPLSPTVAHKSLIVAAELSPNGEFAATCSGERGALRLWRVDNGQTLATCTEHVDDGHSLRAVAFSADSAWCAIAADDGSIRIHRTIDGTVLGRIKQPKDVTALAFDRDGHRLLTGSSDLTARLWRLATGADGTITATESATLVGQTGPVQCVAFDPTGQLALTGGGEQDGGLRIFDVSGGRPIHSYEVGPAIESAQFAPDGRSVVAVAGKGRVVVWDFGTTRGVVTMRQPGVVPAVCFDTTGDRLVTAGDDERLRLWQTQDGRQLWCSEPLGYPIAALDVDPAGERIACSTVVDGLVRVHRLLDGAELFQLRGHRGRVRVVRFARGGNRLLTAGKPDDDGAGGRVNVWNTNDQSLVLHLERPSPVIAADLTADATLLATVEEHADRVRLWSLPDLQPRGELAGHHGDLLSVRFSPDGRLVLTTSKDGTASTQALDGTVHTVFDAGQPLQHGVFSHDGSEVLTCSDGPAAEAQLWRADGTELMRFHGHRLSVECGAFSDDGRWIATCARDGTTCLWPTDPVAAARRLPLRVLTEPERARLGLNLPPTRSR